MDALIICESYETHTNCVCGETPDCGIGEFCPKCQTATMYILTCKNVEGIEQGKVEGDSFRVEATLLKQKI